MQRPVSSGRKGALTRGLVCCGRSKGLSGEPSARRSSKSREKPKANTPRPAATLGARSWRAPKSTCAKPFRNIRNMRLLGFYWARSWNREERIGEAQSACSQSTTVDASYVPAYLCLADVAGHQKQWNQSLDMADRALALGPARSVYAYFYTANARFHLSQLQQAERNALLAIDADRFHRVPQAHLLLAQVYEA